MSGYGALTNPGRVFCSDVEKRPSVETMVTDYLNIAVIHQNKLIDIQRHLAWLLKKSVPDKNLKEKLFKASTLEETVEFLKTSLGMRLQALHDIPENHPNIMEPLKIEDIVDPKKKTIALKKQRQREKKALMKKRAREKKEEEKKNAANSQMEETNQTIEKKLKF